MQCHLLTDKLPPTWKSSFKGDWVLAMVSVSDGDAKQLSKSKSYSHVGKSSEPMKYYKDYQRLQGLPKTGMSGRQLCNMHKELFSGRTYVPPVDAPSVVLMRSRSVLRLDPVTKSWSNGPGYDNILIMFDKTKLASSFEVLNHTNPGPPWDMRIDWTVGVQAGVAQVMKDIKSTHRRGEPFTAMLEHIMCFKPDVSTMLFCSLRAPTVSATLVQT